MTCTYIQKPQGMFRVVNTSGRLSVQSLKRCSPSAVMQYLYVCTQPCVWCCVCPSVFPELPIGFVLSISSMNELPYNSLWSTADKMPWQRSHSQTKFYCHAHVTLKLSLISYKKLFCLKAPPIVASYGQFWHCISVVTWALLTVIHHLRGTHPSCCTHGNWERGWCVIPSMVCPLYS